MKVSNKVENFETPDEHKAKSKLKEFLGRNGSGLILRSKILNLIETSTSHGLPNIVDPAEYL